MSPADSLVTACSPPPGPRTVLVRIRFFHAAAMPGSRCSELMPGWWVSRSFQNRGTRVDDQADEGAVVDAGLALAQVVHEQVADGSATQAVSVDQLFDAQLPGELRTDHPDRGRGPGREDPGGVQELVEERAVPVALGRAGKHLPGDVQQLDAVAGGDVGD
jgi:hypothetical protein